MANDRVRVLDKEALVPLGLACVVILCIVGAAIAITQDLAELKFQVRGIEKDLSKVVNDSLRKESFEAWLEVLQARNPTMEIPEIR